MKIINFRQLSLTTALILAGLTPVSSQIKMTFNQAFNAMNPGSNASSVSVMQSHTGISSIVMQNYTKGVTISYGIPIEIVMEYAALKTRMSSDIASDPTTYNNSAPDVQQAFNNLAYGDFVKISDYNRVNVKLNFRFNPPVLRIYGSDAGDFVNNTQSSPYDPGVYVMPNTPVSGSKTMVIQK